MKSQSPTVQKAAKNTKAKVEQITNNYPCHPECQQCEQLAKIIFKQLQIIQRLQGKLKER